MAHHARQERMAVVFQSVAMVSMAISAAPVGGARGGQPCGPVHSNYSWQTRQKASRSLRKMLGDELRKERLAAGMSQDQLAVKAKLSRNYVSLLELNQNSPTVQVLLRICKALGVKPSKILARIEKD
jgi:ribosome-binding protein aMBF1 (putative translation factor)